MCLSEREGSIGLISHTSSQEIQGLVETDLKLRRMAKRAPHARWLPWTTRKENHTDTTSDRNQREKLDRVKEVGRTCFAFHMLQIRIPYMTPLYWAERKGRDRQVRSRRLAGTGSTEMSELTWKCMWSTIKKPGWRNTLAQMTSWVAGSSDVLAYLQKFEIRSA